MRDRSISVYLTAEVHALLKDPPDGDGIAVATLARIYILKALKARRAGEEQ